MRELSETCNLQVASAALLRVATVPSSVCRALDAGTVTRETQTGPSPEAGTLVPTFVGETIYHAAAPSGTTGSSLKFAVEYPQMLSRWRLQDALQTKGYLYGVEVLVERNPEEAARDPVQEVSNVILKSPQDSYGSLIHHDASSGGGSPLSRRDTSTSLGSTMVGEGPPSYGACLYRALPIHHESVSRSESGGDAGVSKSSGGVGRSKFWITLSAPSPMCIANFLSCGGPAGEEEQGMVTKVLSSMVRDGSYGSLIGAALGAGAGFKGLMTLGAVGAAAVVSPTMIFSSIGLFIGVTAGFVKESQIGKEVLGTGKSDGQTAQSAQ